jgi:branched-chain amino acid transport system ATP-binding protein
MASALELKGVSAGYGETVVLEDINLAVAAGESISVIGRNGVGKTTLLATAMGHTTLHKGEVLLGGQSLNRVPVYRRATAGLGFVPQEREIFPSLTVLENLEVGARPGEWTQARVFELFPNLKERLGSSQGTKLSGGEQQMLAIARILRTGARLLLLDEPTEGLAPVIIQQIGKTIRALKEEGFTILLVEQNFRFASTVADRYYVMEHGRVAESFTNAELEANLDKLHEYLGV